MAAKPDLFKQTREDYIAKAQEIAQELLLKQPSITIEEVTRLHPLPRYLHKNVLGRVFKHNPVFRPIGYTVARRPEARGHVIRVWALNTEFYDARALKLRKRNVEYEDVA